MVEKKVVVKNETGLHARPASMFVQTAENYKSNIKVIKGEEEVNAKSIMGVMVLGVNQGSEIIIQAEGEDEQDAIDSLVNLIDNNFGE